MGIVARAERKPKPFLMRLGPWVTVAGSVVGIACAAATGVLTWKSSTFNDDIAKGKLAQEQQVADLDALIRKNAQDLEKSKDEAERLKYIYGTLVPVILEPAKTNAADAQSLKRKQEAAIAMIGMMLETKDAENLLLSLRSSTDDNVSAVAAQGARTIIAADNAKLKDLVVRSNSDDRTDRLRSTGALEAQYSDSPLAVSLMLDQLADPNKLTPNGFINALYYLTRTTPAAWTPENIDRATQAMPAAQKYALDKGGAQARSELERAKSLLDKLRKP